MHGFIFYDVFSKFDEINCFCDDDFVMINDVMINGLMEDGI
jgi:hypothetical protein